MHTQVHVQAHTCMHRQVHAHVHTCTHAHAHTRIRARAHARTHTHTHTHTRAHTRVAVAPGSTVIESNQCLFLQWALCHRANGTERSLGPSVSPVASVPTAQLDTCLGWSAVRRKAKTSKSWLEPLKRHLLAGQKQDPTPTAPQATCGRPWDRMAPSPRQPTSASTQTASTRCWF